MRLRFGRKAEKIPASRVELFSDETGWKYRLVTKKNVVETQRPLKQRTYTLNRARKEYPGLPVYEVKNGVMEPLPEV